jgi:hypothetical protein
MESKILSNNNNNKQTNNPPKKLLIQNCFLRIRLGIIYSLFKFSILKYAAHKKRPNLQPDHWILQHVNMPAPSTVYVK